MQGITAVIRLTTREQTGRIGREAKQGKLKEKGNVDRKSVSAVKTEKSAPIQ